jgi:erythromycin esterase-like protein
LYGVAATSACDAWAVGYYSKHGADRTLVEHWNGKAWKVQKSPDPSSGGVNVLYGVAAVSASDAWAVGYYFNGRNDQTLVEHWNGRDWKVQQSPDPGGSINENELSSVVAVSGSDAWAVGFDYPNGRNAQTLVEHWNGRAWKVQKSPDPSIDNGLEGVAAASARDAWAVGSYSNGTAGRTLVEHWNGKAWKVQKSPNPGTSASMPALDGVAAVSKSDAWAVGYYSKGAVPQTFLAHWNGKAWKG